MFMKDPDRMSQQELRQEVKQSRKDHPPLLIERYQAGVLDGIASERARILRELK